MPQLHTIIWFRPVGVCSRYSRACRSGEQTHSCVLNISIRGGYRVSAWNPPRMLLASSHACSDNHGVDHTEVINGTKVRFDRAGTALSRAELIELRSIKSSTGLKSAPCRNEHLACTKRSLFSEMIVSCSASVQRRAYPRVAVATVAHEPHVFAI